MIIKRLLVAAALLSLAAAPQPTGWKSLWNGKNLDGWTTWMQAPSATSEVPGLKRDDTGKYLEPIGSGRDPLHVFTVAEDVDGRSAIRISGEAFGELRTKESFKDYHLKFQFKWGEKKWPPRDRPETRRDSGLSRRSRFSVRLRCSVSLCDPVSSVTSVAERLRTSRDDGSVVGTRFGHLPAMGSARARRS